MILEKIEGELSQALKSGDKDRALVWRTVKASFKNKEIELHSPLEEKEVIAVLRGEVKKRKEAEESFTKGNRPELAQKEKKEREIIEEFLPPEAPDEEIRKTVEEVSTKIGKDPKNFGLIMKETLTKLEGRAEGGKVAEVVKEVIGS